MSNESIVKVCHDVKYQTTCKNFKMMDMIKVFPSLTHIVSALVSDALYLPSCPASFSFTGIDLENIVYYKDDTHYFVMTAKKKSLLKKGVIKQVRTAHPLLRQSVILIGTSYICGQ